jgi:hypothetical protein
MVEQRYEAERELLDRAAITQVAVRYWSEPLGTTPNSSPLEPSESQPS